MNDNMHENKYKSYAGTRAEGTASEADSLGLPTQLTSHFNQGYVPDHDDGNRLNDYSNSDPFYGNVHGSSSGRADIYTIQEDVSAPHHLNGDYRHVHSRISHQRKENKIDRSASSHDTRNCSTSRGCMIAIILVIVFLIVAGVVAVILLHLFGFFASKTELKAEYKGEVTFNESWTSALSNNNTERYRNVSRHFVSRLSLILDNTSHVDAYEVEIIAIYPGSIRIVMTLLFADFDPDLTSVIEDGWQNLLTAGETNWTMLKFILLPVQMSSQATDTTTVTTAGPPSSLVFTTPSRITHPPAQDCKILSEAEPRCQNVGYNKYSTVSINYFNELYQLVERNCYEHALLFTCLMGYSHCEQSKERYPCRSFCNDFQSHCSYPIRCDFLMDDDVDEYCYMAPDFQLNDTVSREPVKPPCASGEFRCGDGSCKSNLITCDNKADCTDHKDEIHCNPASPLDCDFEQNSLCNYTNDIKRSHYSWELQKGGTLSADTGPVYDHTMESDLGLYALAEASGQFSYSLARLVSAEVTYSESMCLRFYYHMLGEQIYSLKVHQYYANNALNKEVLLWQRSRGQGSTWRFGSVSLQAGTYQVLFEATRGEGFRSDIALDDITVRAGTCPSPVEDCGPDHYLCDNGACISQTYVCNSKNDCGDFSDENSCNCTEEEFQCGFGMCLPIYMRCNGKVECPDATDEIACELACSHGRHRCSDGTCIMVEWLCDHEADCPDNSDETNCSVCQPDEFRCRDYGCVVEADICDGSNDCTDGSDEWNCFRIRSGDSVIEVRNDNAWKALCASPALPSDTAHNVCKMLGYQTSLGYSILTQTEGLFMLYMAGGAGSFLSHLASVDSCPDDDVMAVECAVTDCGVQTDDVHVEEYIVNGEDVVAGQWPWQIGLYYETFFSCGGSLIDHTHVITAAHCVKFSSDASKYSIILGAVNRTNNPDKNRRQVQVAFIKYHENFTDVMFGDDIAILILEEYVEYTDYIKPICLPNEYDIYSPSIQCYVSGWGKTNFSDPGSIPIHLQEAKMRLWTDKRCKEVHINTDSSMVCAGYISSYASNCQGDSGGPLQCRDAAGHWKLYGVFSYFTRPCNVPLQPPVFTRIHSFLSWIQNNLVTSVTCDFESTEDVCGYSKAGDSSKTEWLRKPFGLSVNNQGPIVDHTMGNASGHYMYAGMGQSVLLSPIFEVLSPSCLQFAYHMRGPYVGTFKVYSVAVPANILHPVKTDLSSAKRLFSISGTQYDIWYSKRLDLGIGRQLVMFASNSVASNKLALVALDDVVLSPGSCAEYNCDGGTIDCDNTCVGQEQQCNYQVSCSNEADEKQCSSQSEYYCSMETYGHCLLEQDAFLSDHRDWVLLQSTDRNPGPAGDHTTGIYGGYLLYFSTQIGLPGSFAVVQLTVKVKQVSCLQFYYSMRTASAFRVIVCTKELICTILWSVSGMDVASWRQVRLPLETAVGAIRFHAYTYTLTEPQAYIAIDDISIEHAACENPDCRSDQYRCGDGPCIDRFHMCDGIIDCADGSDETPDTCPCWPDMFICNDACIQGYLQCDGIDDCSNGEDEYNCVQDVCPGNEFRCNDGTCKNRFAYCDGFEDCPDKSDESFNCSCREDQFQCAESGYCIPGYKFCDNIIDCADASDEAVWSCSRCDSTWSFSCNDIDKTCIPRELTCDGVADCLNDADENPTTCEYRCNDGKVLTRDRVCDGLPQCSQGEDEAPDCVCPFGYERCSGGGCISVEKFCDGRYDCKDKSDETNCNCDAHTFQCSTGRCLPESLRCDTHVDCDDLSDELLCHMDVGCLAGEFNCSNGMCISNSQHCDGQFHCGDSSDEIDCNCGTDRKACSMDHVCVPNLWFCDGELDCSDGQDEINCNRCSDDMFQCVSDYSCLAADNRCDGTWHCADGSDENSCEKLSTEGLLQGFYEDSWFYVCSDNWRSEWGDHICRRLGNSIAQSQGVSPVSELLYLRAGTSTDNILFNAGLLSVSATCESGEAVRITCDELGCGKRPSIATALIIGGRHSQDNDWPWMASLSYLGAHRCGAALIHPQWLVTAAHCFQAADRGDTQLWLTPQYITITLGTTKITTHSGQHGKTYNVSKIIAHENYHFDDMKEGMLFDDIALVKLSMPIQLNSGVKPVCLPNNIQQHTLKKRCYTVGWGFVNTDSDPENFIPITDLQEGKLRLWMDEECTSETSGWGANVNVTKHLCAGYEQGTIMTCNGDSGGPLMCEDLTGHWELFGVTSVGTTTCGQGDNPKPGVFTRVSNYIDWIQRQIKSNS